MGKNLPDVHSGQMLALAHILYEHLRVDIIAELPGECFNVPHDLQQIHALLQSLNTNTDV